MGVGMVRAENEVDMAALRNIEENACSAEVYVAAERLIGDTRKSNAEQTTPHSTHVRAR
jgi:hypothetical protein